MTAKNGDTVKIHYIGKLEDGRVFDTSREKQPLEMTIGGGEVIPGFEKAIIGMEPGETKTFEVSPEEGYGPKREELLFNVKRSNIPEHINPFVGQQLQVSQQDGNLFDVTIASMDEETVTLDANHPLAGEVLTFEVELVEIV